MNEIQPYGDYLFIAPVESVSVLGKTLNCYAKVLAIGPDTKHTTIGDYVAFEKWDKPEFLIGERVFHFLHEADAITKLPYELVK